MNEGVNERMLDERIHFGYYKDTTRCDKPRIFYVVKQRLVWKFYMRFFKTDLKPCGNCQRKIQDEFIRIFKREVPIEDANFFVSSRWQGLCKRCKTEFEEMLKNQEVILGNKDYTPLLELTRVWLNVDETYKEITKEEYYLATTIPRPQ